MAFQNVFQKLLFDGVFFSDVKARVFSTSTPIPTELDII